MTATIGNSGFSYGPDIPKERVTLAVPVIDTDHAYVHEGYGYSLEGTFAANGTAVIAVGFNPPAAAAAKATAVMVDTDANILYTFNKNGFGGNDWDVVHADPSGINQPLKVSVAGTVITVSLKTNATADIVSTAAEVVAAVNASDAGEHVTASLVSTGGTVNAVAKIDLAGGADDVYIHFQTTDVTADAALVVVDIIEGATFTGTAATLTPYNRNRVNPIASKAAITASLGATVAVTSVVYLDKLTARGSATGPNKAVHSKDQGAQELVLMPGKKYVVRFTPAGATAIDYRLFWYEEMGA
jgi:hypothetical protein